MAFKTFNDYIDSCIKHCTSRLDELMFDADEKQSNAIRVESLRDKSDRCGSKMPEHWSKEVKQRGWGIWIFSGGSPSVFGHCQKNDCPMMRFFIKSAPRKKWRENNEDL